MSWQSLFEHAATADGILLTAFHSLWLSLVAFMILRMRRFRAPAVRSAWCTFMLILLLILPLITWFVPRPVIRTHPDQKASISTSVVSTDVEAPLLNNLLAINTPAPQARIDQWKVWMNRFGLIWLAVTLACVGRLLYGMMFLKGYCDCLREVKDDRLTAILQGNQRIYLVFDCRPRFFVSLTLPSPVSMGIRKPVVILPADIVSEHWRRRTPGDTAARTRAYPPLRPHTWVAAAACQGAVLVESICLSRLRYPDDSSRGSKRQLRHLGDGERRELRHASGKTH